MRDRARLLLHSRKRTEGVLFIVAGLCFLTVPADDRPVGLFVTGFFLLAAALCFFGKRARPAKNVGFVGLGLAAFYFFLGRMPFFSAFFSGLGCVLALIAFVLAAGREE